MGTELSMVVYKITNVVNGKIYIGQTITSLYQRTASHKSDAKRGKRTALCCAIRKYGFGNFKFEVIDVCQTHEELNKAEIHWIKHYNTVKKGYNSTVGGDKPPVMRGKNNPMFGKKRPDLAERNRSRRFRPVKEPCTREEINRRISVAQKRAWADGKHSSEHFKEFAKARIGTVGGVRAKAVICIENSTVYPSMNVAGKQLEVSPSNICTHLHGKLRGVSGYTFRYATPDEIASQKSDI